MISGTRSQNIIVLATIVLGIVGGASLVSSTSLYSGSYVMVTRLDVELEQLTIINFDPESFDPDNTSVVPVVRLSFSFKVVEGVVGEADLRSIGASVMLNGESFDYAAWFSLIPAADRSLYGGYNKTFSLSAGLEQAADKLLLKNAADTDTWNFIVRLTLHYTVFKSAQSVRGFAFVHNGID